MFLKFFYKEKLQNILHLRAKISAKLPLIGQDRTSVQFLLNYFLVLHEIYKGKS